MEELVVFAPGELDRKTLLKVLQNAFNEFSEADFIFEMSNVITQVNNGYILLGAGNLGNKIVSRTRNTEIAPLAIADNFKCGLKLAEYEIGTVEDAVEKFGMNKTFVVSIWQGSASQFRFETIQEQLLSVGVKHVISVAKFFWAYPEFFLPYLICEIPTKTFDARREIIDLANHIEELYSLDLFVRHVIFRLNGDFRLLLRSPGDEYWNRDLLKFNGVVNFFDLGAFDGDTIKSGLDAGIKFNAIAAVEPDSGNFDKLIKFADENKDKAAIETFREAVKDTPGEFEFYAHSNLTSRLKETTHANYEDLTPETVSCTTIDQLVHRLGWAPTHLKMDIEGAEKAAFKGGIETLRSFKPQLMIALEHSYEDLWKIPNLIRNEFPEYKFFLRHHSEQGLDTCLYATTF